MTTTTQPAVSLHGDAYDFVYSLYCKSPGQSWRRLNGALQDALSAAITGHLAFHPDDFAAMYRTMSGSYWMGNSSGHFCGEGFYTQAVRCGHVSACISFERFTGRPAALWSETVKTPTRLAIGSDITWEGARLVVSNFFPKYLTAVSYPKGSTYEEEGEDGSTIWMHSEYRRIEHSKDLENGGRVVRLSPPQKGRAERKPDRIVKITYAELQEHRRSADAVRREVLKAIEAAATPEELNELEQRVYEKRGTYRHFDIEDFRKACSARRSKFDQAAVAAADAVSRATLLERWIAGEDVHAFFEQVLLRVHGEYVETSTGHKVALSAARRLMPYVLEHRGDAEYSGGLQIEIHDIKKFSEEGVLIGCTLIPWLEVERLNNTLKEMPA